MACLPSLRRGSPSAMPQARIKRKRGNIVSSHIRNNAELRATVRAEQAKVAKCEGACFGDMLWHGPDAGGL